MNNNIMSYTIDDVWIGGQSVELPADVHYEWEWNHVVCGDQVVNCKSEFYVFDVVVLGKSVINLLGDDAKKELADRCKSFQESIWDQNLEVGEPIELHMRAVGR